MICYLSFMVALHVFYSPISAKKGARAALACLALTVGACRGEVPGDQESVTESVANKQAPEVAPVQTPDVQPLAAVGRADLIAVFARAQDATAAGRPLPDANRQLVGRTFSLKLPFGCSGEPSKQGSSWAGWTFDRNREALKLSVNPERWTEADWVKSIAGDLAHEAVEGFWIERPWTRSEDCPADNAADPAGEAIAHDRQTVGIAQFFAPGSSRTFQRGSRAYSHTIRVREPAEIEGRTYRLVLSGRVTGFPDGQPIHCGQDSPYRRPVCLMAVEFAKVSFEDSRDGNILVEWRN